MVSTTSEYWGSDMGRRSKNRPPKPKKQEVSPVVAPDFPTQEVADPTDPADFAVWVFAGMPHMKGAPLGMPVWYLRELSKRLWDAGFRHHPELQTIKYRRPHAGQGVGMLTAAGEWVPIDEPDPTEQDAADALIAAMQQLPAPLREKVSGAVTNALGVPEAHRPADDLVPYTRADGTTKMVTTAQARAWRNARKAAGGWAGPDSDGAGHDVPESV